MHNVWIWELDHKGGWVPKNWCFQTAVLEKTLESPLDSNEVKAVNPKGNQPWILIGRIDAEAESENHSIISDFLWPPWITACQCCLSLSPRACSNSCPLSRWCLPTILPSIAFFSSCLQSFPAPGSFPINWLFTSGSQSIGASASAWVLPMNIQGWFLLGWTGLISLQSKGLSRVFSSTILTPWFIFLHNTYHYLTL